MLELQVPPGVSLNQDVDEPGGVDKVVKQERRPNLKITQCMITPFGGAETPCAGTYTDGVLDRKAMQVTPGRMRWYNLITDATSTADPTAYELLD